MIRTTWRVEGRAKGRYVKKAIGQNFYKWCEQSLDDPRYDVAQGTCEAEDLPPNIRMICDKMDGRCGTMYSCEWPF